jgi:predicted NAD-dependent protein-ADP-ribosyltransferase YbiA (DUF1768 family)
MKNFLKPILGCLFPLLVSCATTNSHAPYPEEWWKPAPKEGAPAWEILPQEVNAGEVRLSKRNELGILSNFAPTPFVFEGVRYASLEGFWQMTKYPEGPKDERLKPQVKWPHTREEVGGMTAFKAKAAGDEAESIMKQLGIDWVTYRGRKMKYFEDAKGDFYKLIVAAMKEKLKQNPKVREVLLKTGDLKLLPDHHQEAGAPPAWRYNEIWMEIRDELRKELVFQHDVEAIKK